VDYAQGEEACPLEMCAYQAAPERRRNAWDFASFLLRSRASWRKVCAAGESGSFSSVYHEAVKYLRSFVREACSIGLIDRLIAWHGVIGLNAVSMTDGEP
jgi:hypothetical protein